VLRVLRVLGIWKGGIFRDYPIRQQQLSRLLEEHPRTSDLRFGSITIKRTSGDCKRCGKSRVAADCVGAGGNGSAAVSEETDYLHAHQDQIDHRPRQRGRRTGLAAAPWKRGCRSIDSFARILRILPGGKGALTFPGGVKAFAIELCAVLTD
jgi:hypothetical protein